MERRLFFNTLMGEIVPRAANARKGPAAERRRSILERLDLSAEQAQQVQAIYERHADRDELARRELRRLIVEQQGLFLTLDEARLRAIGEKLTVQRTILHEISSERTLAICRILNASQRQLFVDTRPTRQLL